MTTRSFLRRSFHHPCRLRQPRLSLLAFAVPEILAPAQTPEQLEARRQALAARETLCREEQHHCEEPGGGHAH